MNYGNAIRVARAVRGLSQKALAERAHLDSSYVSLLEKRSRMPSSSTIEALSAALDVPSELFQLLASEQEDLQSISTDQAAALGKNLLELLVQTSEAQS